MHHARTSSAISYPSLHVMPWRIRPKELGCCRANQTLKRPLLFPSLCSLRLSFPGRPSSLLLQTLPLRHRSSGSSRCRLLQLGQTTTEGKRTARVYGDEIGTMQHLADPDHRVQLRLIRSERLNTVCPVSWTIAMERGDSHASNCCETCQR